MDDQTSPFRQKPADIVPTGQDQQAVDANPSQLSGTNSPIQAPIWESFVTNTVARKHNREIVAQEQAQVRQSQSAANTPLFKGVNGKLIRKTGRKTEIFNAEDFADDPWAGSEARKSIWDREVKSSEKAASDASFRLRDPSFNARGLAKKDREAIEAEGSMLDQSDPRHIELKAKLVADSEYQEEKTRLEQEAWDHGNKARQLKDVDPEDWYLNGRNQPTEAETRQAAVTSAQNDRAAAQQANDAATARAAELRAKLAKGVKGTELDAINGELKSIAEHQGVIAEAEGESNRSLAAVQAEAAAKTPPKDFFRAGDTISGIWDAVRGLGTSAPAAFYQLVEGMERPDQYSDSAKKAFAEADAFNKEMQAKTAANQAAGTSSSVGESFREAGGSLGFSLGSMAAAIPASMAGAKAGAVTGATIAAAAGFAGPQAATPEEIVTVPVGAGLGGLIGGGAAAMAASGSAAYRMAGASFLNETFQRMEQEAIASTGKGMSEADKQAAYDALLPIAKNTALWEAGPEAVGNAVMLGAGKLIFGKGIVKTLESWGLKSAAKAAVTLPGKVAVRTAAGAASLATELAGETVTQVEQGADQLKGEAIAQGEDPNAIQADWSAGGIVEAFKEVAPQTLALMGLMGGAGGMVKVASNITGIGKTKEPGKPDTGRIKPEDIKPDIDRALASINPEHAPADPQEIHDAAFLNRPEDGAPEMATSVLINRELAAIAEEDAQILPSAEQGLIDAQATGDKIAIKAAESQLEKAAAAPSRAPLVRATLRIAAGQRIDQLNSDELAAIGYEAKELPKAKEGDKDQVEFAPIKPAKGSKGAPAIVPMIRKGADGSMILTDAAIAQVKSISPMAGERIAMSESEAIQKAIERKQKLSDAASNDAQGNPAMGAPSDDGMSSPPSETGAASEFNVSLRDGTLIRVPGATAAEAEENAAASLPMGTTIITGSAVPIAPAVTQVSAPSTQVSAPSTQVSGDSAQKPAAGVTLSNGSAPNKHGVFDEAEAESIDHKGKKASASIKVAQLSDGSWIASTQYEHRTGSMQGMSSPLMADKSYPTREAAIAAAAQTMASQNEGIVTGRSSMTNDNERAEAKRIVAWAQGLIGGQIPGASPANTGSESANTGSAKPTKDKATATAAAKKLIAKVKKNKRLAASLVEGTERAITRPTGIVINPDQIIDEAIQAGMTPNDAGKYFSRVLDEEVRHLAQYDAAAILQKQAGDTGDLLEWMESHYSKLWASDFTGANQDKGDYVRDLYTGKDAELLKEWDVMSDGSKALEAIRIMSQGKSVTEQARLWTNISAELKKAIKAALNALLRYSDVASPEILIEIENLKNALANLTNDPVTGVSTQDGSSSRNPQKKQAATRSNAGTGKTAEAQGARADAGDGGTDPIRRETPVPSTLVGAKVEYQKNGVTYTATVRVDSGNAIQVHEMSPADPNGLPFHSMRHGDFTVIEMPKSQTSSTSPPADEWENFKPESGTLGIPRAEMPQSGSGDRSALLQFLRARGIDYREETVPSDTLKPTQAEFSREKVAKARENTEGDRALLVSSDDHLVDGHHQWLAADHRNTPVRIIRLEAPIMDILDVIHDMPSVETEDAKPTNDGETADVGEADFVNTREEIFTRKTILNSRRAQLGITKKQDNEIRDLFTASEQNGTMDELDQAEELIAGYEAQTAAEAKPANESDIDKAANFYSAYHSSRIRKDAEKNPSWAETYLTDEMARWTPEAVRERVAVFVEEIRNKDVKALMRYNNGMFDGFWKIFGMLTTTKVPKTQKGIEAVIRAYVGEEVYLAQQARDEAGRAKRDEERAAKDEKSRIERLQFGAERLSVRHEGKDMNGRELADQLLAEGWRVENTSTGPIPRYQFIKGDRSIKNSKGFGDIYAYAREVQKNMDEAEIAREDAEFDALPQEEKDAIESLFTPGGTKPMESPSAWAARNMEKASETRSRIVDDAAQDTDVVNSIQNTPQNTAPTLAKVIKKNLLNYLNSGNVGSQEYDYFTKNIENPQWISGILRDVTAKAAPAEKAAGKWSYDEVKSILADESQPVEGLKIEFRGSSVGGYLVKLYATGDKFFPTAQYDSNKNRIGAIEDIAGRVAEYLNIHATRGEKSPLSGKAEKAPSVAKPVLTDVERELESFLEDIGGGLDSSPISPEAFYRGRGIPRDKRAAFLELADKLYDRGMREPKDLAASLAKIGGGKFKQYSEGLWSSLRGSYPELPVTDSWADIYGELDSKAEEADIASDETDQSSTGGNGETPSGNLESGVAGTVDPVTSSTLDSSSDQERQPNNGKPSGKSGNSGTVGGRSPRQGDGTEAPGDPAGAGSGRGAESGNDGTDSSNTGNGSGVAGGEQPTHSPGRTGYRLTDPETILGSKGPKDRFARNRKALETFDTVFSEERDPTPEELDALAAYIGWGSFGQELFQGSWDRPNPKPEWEKESEWLRDHLGKEGWESIRDSIINAHYTDPPHVAALWKIVEHLGFKGGRTLEPSMGIGNFFGLMPDVLRANSSLTGIELDRVVGGMAKMLYPDANIRIMGYEKSATADDFYDLVIGNWPFAKDGPSDPRYNHLGLSLHDYFFVKALDQVRPGGLVVGITSSGTMDKKGQVARRQIAKRAELIGAFRFPTGAFKGYAGTSVVTDVLVLQKRAEQLADAANEEWIGTERIGEEGRSFNANIYWRNNPSHILGEMKFGHGTTFGRAGMIVERPDNYADLLGAIQDKLPQGIYSETRPSAERKVFQNRQDGMKQNSVVWETGETGNPAGFYVVRGEQLQPLESLFKWEVKDKAKNAKRSEELKSLLQLREQVRALLESQRENSSSAEDLRAEALASYKAFAKKYGSIEKSFMIKAMEKANDPMTLTLQNIERREGLKVVPRDILLKDIMRRPTVDASGNIEDAYALQRNESTVLDLARIAEMSESTEQEVIDRLLELNQIYKTPSGAWEVGEEYLGGNVRRKLREAKDAKEQGFDMDRNIAALENIQPTDVAYFEVEVQMGASWIPREDYLGYVSHLLGSDPASANQNFSLVKGSSGWNFKVDNAALSRGMNAQEKWGVSQLPFAKIFQAALNGTQVKVWHPKDEDGRVELNEDATKIANGKIDSIREELAEWLWSDPERTGRLSNDYNEVMNSEVTPKRDGSHLRLEGLTLSLGKSEFDFREHQKNAVWRFIMDGKGVGAHEVGTGKTFTMAGLAVEGRRLGKFRKTLLFAHNANSQAVYEEFQMAYPNGKFLYIDNLSPENRDAALRQIALDEWDAVIVPHSLVDRFTLSEKSLMEVANKQIVALENEIAEALTDIGYEGELDLDDSKAVAQALKYVKDSYTAKELVKQRAKIVKRIKDKAAESQASGAILFEELGIDNIIVDEAHVFKKINLATRKEIKGLNKVESGIGWQMGALTDYVKSRNSGNGVYLFTGTPLTNNLNEAYNMMRFVMDQEMADTGIDNFDDWFNSFAAAVSDVELTTGGTHEPVTRLLSFVNVPELARLAGRYFDVVLAKDMPEFKDRESAEGMTEDPQGRPFRSIKTVISDMSPQQRAHKEEIRQQYIAYQKMDGKGKRLQMTLGRPTPITMEGHGTASALDYRLVDPDAPDYSGSKINMMIGNAVTHFNEHPESTQMIFMERGFNDYTDRMDAIRDGQGMPSYDDEGKMRRRKVRHRKFNLARDIVEKLMAQGVAPEEIAILSNMSLDPMELRPNDPLRKVLKVSAKLTKADIASLANEGKIRFMIGGTETMGTGVNAQRNLRAMHHLDAPWTPGALEQRNGRGWRQGNRWNTVNEYRYFAEGSHDGRRWQVLLNKVRFIYRFTQMLLNAGGENNLRVLSGDGADMNEGGSSVADFEQSFSAAAGDPRLLLRAKLTADVEKLERRRDTHFRSIEKARQSISGLKRDKAWEEEQLSKFSKVVDVFKDTFSTPFEFTFQGDKFTERKKVEEAMVTTPKFTRSDNGKIVGQYGDNIKLRVLWQDLRQDSDWEIIITLPDGREHEMIIGSQSLASIEGSMRGFMRNVSNRQERFGEYDKSIASLTEMLGKPFTRQPELEGKQKALEQIKSELAQSPFPAPSWLRNGAPSGSLVYIDGKARDVGAHRWDRTGYWLLLESENGLTPVDYKKAKDEAGNALFEEHPFESPPDSVDLSEDEIRGALGGEFFLANPDDTSASGDGWHVSGLFEDIGSWRIYNSEGDILGEGDTANAAYSDYQGQTSNLDAPKERVGTFDSSGFSDMKKDSKGQTPRAIVLRRQIEGLEKALATHEEKFEDGKSPRYEEIRHRANLAEMEISRLRGESYEDSGRTEEEEEALVEIQNKIIDEYENYTDRGGNLAIKDKLDAARKELTTLELRRSSQTNDTSIPYGKTRMDDGGLRAGRLGGAPEGEGKVLGRSAAFELAKKLINGGGSAELEFSLASSERLPRTAVKAVSNYIQGEIKAGTPKTRILQAVIQGKADTEIGVGETFYTPSVGESMARISDDLGLRAAKLGGDNAPAFFSQLSRTIEAKMPKSATPAQVAQIASSGAKAEEVKWAGLIPWMQGRDKVSKDEVLKFLENEGSVKFEEVNHQGKDIEPRYGDLSPEMKSLVDQIESEEVTNQEAVERAERLGWVVSFGMDGELEEVREIATGRPTQYSKYTLPGGENYREVVLAMPNESKKHTVFQDEKGAWEVLAPEGGDNIFWIGAATRKEAQEYADARDAAFKSPSEYTSSHFPDVPNYVAHMRLNERDAPLSKEQQSRLKDLSSRHLKSMFSLNASELSELQELTKGNPGLFIEELQSDRHQAGRKQGYKGEVDTVAAINKLTREQATRIIKVNERGNDTLEGDEDIEDLRAIVREYLDNEGEDETGETFQFLKNLAGTDGIADAPFRTTWPLALFKRALRDAVASGKTWIGWTTGETQNDRFDLSKQVEYIRSEATNDGFHYIDIKPTGDDKMTFSVYQGKVTPDSEHFSGQALADIIGKDMAEKALAVKPGRERPTQFAGKELKVGGSGMKGFYDNMLPKEIGKYVKQWGGKVEQSDIHTKDGWPRYVPIWRIDITPEMAKSVKTVGQALFAGKLNGAPEEDNTFTLTRSQQALHGEAVLERELFRQGDRKNIASGKLAGFGSDQTRDVLDGYDAVYEFTREVQKNADQMRVAKEMLARDPKDIAAKLKDAVTGKVFNQTPADHLAIQLLIDQNISAAKNDKAKLAEAGAMAMAYRMMRGDAGRLLQIGYDRSLTPDERNLAAITDALFTPTRKIQKVVASKPIAEREAWIRRFADERIATVNKELAEANLTIGEITNQRDYLSLEKSNLMTEVMKLRKALDQDVLKMIQHGAAIADIKRRYGAEVAATAQDINRQAREELKAKIGPMVAAGMTMEEIVKKIGSLSAGGLAGNGGSMDANAMAAEIERILAIGFGLPSVVPEKNVLKRLSVKRPKPIADESAIAADWSRPQINDALNHYAFDTKDRAGIMKRVETIRLLAGAVGKIDKLDFEKRKLAEQALSEIDGILVKYGTNVNDILTGDKHIEDYRFDIKDINHVAYVARMISTMDADWIDKTSELLYANMLSGLQTMLVNATAVVPAAWEATVGRGVEMAINMAFNDPMSAQLGEAKYIMKALGPAWSRALSNFSGSIQTQHPMADRDLLGQQPDIERVMGGKGYRMGGSISGKKGDIIRIPTRLLMATDDFNVTLFSMATVGTYAFRLAKAEGLKPGTPEFDRFMKIQINTPGKEAWIMAFMKAKNSIFANPLPGEKDNVTGKIVPVHGIGDKIGQLAGSITAALSKEQDSMVIKAMQLMMKISFFPFQRVPFNILRKGVRYTLNPISAFDIGLGFVQNSRVDTKSVFSRKGWKWNEGGRNADLLERTGQQLQGAILLLILLGASAGEGDDDDQDKGFIITGSAPFTPRGRAERAAQMRAGVGPMRLSWLRKDGSERFGINYGRIEPISTVLGATVDSIRAFKRTYRAGGDTSQAASELLGGMVAQSQDKTFLRGVSDLMALVTNAIAEPDVKENRKVQQFLAGRVAMIVPNIIKQPIRETDSVYRERSNGFMEELLYQVTPTGQKQAKVDPYGREEVKTGTAVTRIFDPTDGGTTEINPVDKMLLKWRDSGKWAKAPDEGDRKPWFPAAIYSAEFKNPRTGQNQKMNEEQLAEFRQRAGKLAMEMLKRENLNYDNPTITDVLKVKKVITESRRNVKAALSFKFSK